MDQVEIEMIEAEEEVKQPRIRTSTSEEFLECKLTDEELIECAKDQNAQIKQCLRLEGQKKAYNSQIKSEIETCEECISELSNKISSQAEYRHIECQKIEDFDEGTVTVTRLDTGEVITDRKMTRVELAEADDLFIEYDNSADETDVPYEDTGEASE